MKNAIGHELCPELMERLGIQLKTEETKKDTATLQERLQNNGKLMGSLEEAIKAAGLPIITPVLVCNTDDYPTFETVTGKDVTNDDVVIELAK